MKLKKWEIGILGILVVTLCLWAFWPKKPGNRVAVTVDGTPVLNQPLTGSGTYPLEGYGGFSLVLVIENGRAWVEDSTCPDLICENHTPISKAGEQIVCLPGRMVISITGQEAEVDAFTG